MSLPAGWVVWALLLPAFLAELLFYLLPASARFQRAFGRLGLPVQALLLFVSALIPFVLLHLFVGPLASSELLLLAAIAGGICGWFVLLPKKAIFDLLLLGVLAALLLNKPWWAALFTVNNSVNTTILGQSLWYRLGIGVFLFHRKWPGTGFGFWPSRRDWLIGLQQFGLLLVVLFPLLWSFGTVRFQLPKMDLYLVPLLAVATFFGVLWFLAVWEEFFFRGVLQQLMQRELGNRWAGLVVTSLLFGAVHLPYRQFPNWRFAVAAAIAGVFYGLAFERAKSMRAAMVTHALVVTAWTVLFGRSI
jgi:uncharacterized protein